MSCRSSGGNRVVLTRLTWDMWGGTIRLGGSTGRQEGSEHWEHRWEGSRKEQETMNEKHTQTKKSARGTAWICWLVLIGKAQVLLSKCPSEPACTIPAPLNRSSQMEFSCRSLYYTCVVPVVTCQTVFCRKRADVEGWMKQLMIIDWCKYEWCKHDLIAQNGVQFSVQCRWEILCPFMWCTTPWTPFLALELWGATSDNPCNFLKPTIRHLHPPHGEISQLCRDEGVGLVQTSLSCSFCIFYSWHKFFWE